MPIERIARGTAEDKTGALTLTIPNVTLDSKCTLVVGISYDSGSGNPIIKWGDHRLRRDLSIDGGGVHTGILKFQRKGHVPVTHDLVATWTDPPLAKVMFATQVNKEASIVDQSSADLETADDAPVTGAQLQTVWDDEIAICAFGSEGPPTDPAGTPSLGFSSGQRIGTTGDADESNITIQEIYKITTTTELLRGRITGVTARDWANCIITLRKSQWQSDGVTSSDLMLLEGLFEAAGHSMNDALFYWNSELDRWEVYVIDSDTLPAVFAHTGEGGWVQ